MALRVRFLMTALFALALPLSAAQPQEARAAEPDYAIQLLYAIPKDGLDEGLDQEGTILNSVESAQEWLEGETDGRRLNFVSDADGVPTIERIELTRTEDELMSQPDSDSSYQIEYEIRAAGYDEPGILYAIYYEGAGEGDDFCGATPSPEYGPANSATLYVQSGCNVFNFVGEGDDADFWELTLMHELFHAFGAVPNCAPNNDNGHVDDPHDLMFGEAEPWQFPVHLDVDHDDYYGHGRHACYDTARSPYFVPAADDAEPYPSDFVEIALDRCPLTADEPLSDEADAEVWVFNITDAPIELQWLSPAGDTEDIDTVEPWSGLVLTTLSGDTLLALDESGDCFGSFVTLDSIDIGVVWLEP